MESRRREQASLLCHAANAGRGRPALSCTNAVAARPRPTSRRLQKCRGADGPHTSVAHASRCQTGQLSIEMLALPPAIERRHADSVLQHGLVAVSLRALRIVCQGPPGKIRPRFVWQQPRCAHSLRCQPWIEPWVPGLLRPIFVMFLPIEPCAIGKGRVTRDRSRQGGMVAPGKEAW